MLHIPSEMKQVWNEGFFYGSLSTVFGVYLVWALKQYLKKIRNFRRRPAGDLY